MKKVGILSMQRIANYGSFLQAYGLKSMIEELGYEVQFVDYHPGETLIPADGGTGLKRKVSKVLKALKYSAPLKEKIKFIKYKKNYATKNYPYLGIDELNYLPKLDTLVIGSDEVFNCVQNNSNVGFSPELFGVGNKANKVITYAASFGNTTEEKLKEYHIDEKISEWLKKYNAISVRDKNSGSIVKSLIDKETEYNLDPVLVYDYIGKCKKIPASVPDEKYLILYGYAGRFNKEECKVIKDFAKGKGLKILNIGGIQNACDKFIDCNPFEVIAYFQNAAYVITDTFHGTILSVITHRQFVTVIRNSGYGNSEKLTDLLTRLRLNDRQLMNIDELKTKLNKPINYDTVDEYILSERECSYKYLRENLM